MRKRGAWQKAMRRRDRERGRPAPCLVPAAVVRMAPGRSSAPVGLACARTAVCSGGGDNVVSRACADAIKVMVATKPVDFRKGAEGLAALVRETMGADPFSGAVYVFRAMRTDRIKLIFWDGTGVCLYAKRLEDGEFRWPKVQDGMMRLTATQLSTLLEGLDWWRVPPASAFRHRRVDPRGSESALLPP